MNMNRPVNGFSFNYSPQQHHQQQQKVLHQQQKVLHQQHNHQQQQKVLHQQHNYQQEVIQRQPKQKEHPAGLPNIESARHHRDYNIIVPKGGITTSLPTKNDRYHRDYNIIAPKGHINEQGYYWNNADQSYAHRLHQSKIFDDKLPTRNGSRKYLGNKTQSDIFFNSSSTSIDQKIKKLMIYHQLKIKLFLKKSCQISIKFKFKNN